MLEPEQLKELKTRLDSLGKKGKKHTTDAVHLLRNDLKLILDMHDGPEKTALEQRFMQGLLQTEDAAWKIIVIFLEAIEMPESRATLSPAYQIYLTPDMASALEQSAKTAEIMKDEFVSTSNKFTKTMVLPENTSGIYFVSIHTMKGTVVRKISCIQ